MPSSALLSAAWGEILGQNWSVLKSYNSLFYKPDGIFGRDWACWSEWLSDSQVEDIFWNNAAELFEIR